MCRRNGGERDDGALGQDLDAVQSVLDRPQESALEFGEQEGELVGRAAVVVVGHELVEAGHQTFDVDEPVGVTVALGFEQPACRPQTAHGFDETVVLEVADQQRRTADEGARETGAGDKHAVRPVGRGHEAAGVRSRR